MLKSTARAIRALLDRERVLSLAVIADGTPYAGLLPFIPLPGYAGVMIHASRMAKHSAGLTAGARVGVLLHEQDGTDKDPLQLQRTTFESEVHALERKGEAWLAGRERWRGRTQGGRCCGGHQHPAGRQPRVARASRRSAGRCRAVPG